MANRTDPNAISVHGTNPQNLIEKIIRLKIHACNYWKEKCYALTAETLVDRAVELEYIGGTYGGSRKPAPFLCLILKMLQLQPELEIVYEFVKNKDYKYVTALGCFYLRLIGRAEDIYNYLEPLYNDYRKLRLRETDGGYRLIHVDEFVEDLIYKEAVCDTVLPRILKRQILEDSGSLKPRHSVLEDIDDDDESLLAEIMGENNADNKEQTGVVTGDNELIENPRAAALKGNRSSEEKELDEKEEKRKRKEEKKKNKEKKKKKYRSRRSLSRSRSRSRRRDESDRSNDSNRSSRSRSRSRSEKKKKKSKWKKEYKERRRDKDRSKDREREEKHEKNREKDKEKEKENKIREVPVDENSDEYWLSLRAKIGLKPAS